MTPTYQPFNSPRISRVMFWMTLGMAALITLSAHADSTATASTLNPNAASSLFMQNMTQTQNNQENHLANIDDYLNYKNFEAQQLYTDLGMQTLNTAYPLNASIPAQPLTINQYWALFCGNNTSTETTTLPASASFQSTVSSPGQLDLTCVDLASASNSNNIIPLLMAPSTTVVNAANPTNNNAKSSDGSSDINQLIGGLQTSSTTQNAVQAYISALTAPPSIAATIPTDGSTLPEMTLISSVLQTIASDYQANGPIPAINTAVNQAFTPAYSNDLAHANVPQLLRMLIIETAKDNQIKALQIEQQERNNMLLAAVLADLVKINQSNAAIYKKLGDGQALDQQTQSILLQMNYALQKQAQGNNAQENTK